MSCMWCPGPANRQKSRALRRRASQRLRARPIRRAAGDNAAWRGCGRRLEQSGTAGAKGRKSAGARRVAHRQSSGGYKRSTSPPGREHGSASGRYAGEQQSGRGRKPTPAAQSEAVAPTPGASPATDQVANPNASAPPERSDYDGLVADASRSADSLQAASDPSRDPDDPNWPQASCRIACRRAH